MGNIMSGDLYTSKTAFTECDTLPSLLMYYVLLLIVPDSRLNSHDRELLTRLSLHERLDGPVCECDSGIIAPLKRIRDTGVCARERLTACPKCPAGPARER